jgi:hypothetical protein
MSKRSPARRSSRRIYHGKSKSASFRWPDMIKNHADHNQSTEKIKTPLQPIKYVAEIFRNINYDVLHDVRYGSTRQRIRLSRRVEIQQLRMIFRSFLIEGTWLDLCCLAGLMTLNGTIQVFVTLAEKDAPSKRSPDERAS